MVKKLSFGLVSALLVLLATACHDKIAPLAKIPLLIGDYQSSQLAMAVGPGGVIHIARTECPTGSSTQCRFVISKIRGGSSVNRLLPEAPFPNVVNMTDPDIAVTDSGVAYYVVRLHYNDGHVYDYWRSDEFPDVFYRLDPDRTSIGPAKVAASGETVYAVYQALDLSEGYLVRYKQLAGGTHSGTIASMNSVLETDLALAPADKLFVSFRGLLLGRQQAWFCEISGVSGSIVCPGHDSPLYEMPALRLDKAGSVMSIAWVYNSKYDPLVLERCPTNDCTNHLVDDLNELPSEQHWTITAPVCLATDETATYVAFTAWNVNLPVGQTEVYRYTFMPGTPTGSPTQITNNSEVESAPQCAFYNDGADSGFVIGWRTVNQDAFGSIYVWDAVNGTRLIHPGVSDGRTGFEMNGSGRNLAGIANILTSGKIEPWVSFNAELAFLPLLRK